MHCGSVCVITGESALSSGLNMPTFKVIGLTICKEGRLETVGDVGRDQEKMVPQEITKAGRFTKEEVVSDVQCSTKQSDARSDSCPQDHALFKSLSSLQRAVSETGLQQRQPLRVQSLWWRKKRKEKDGRCRGI